MSAHLHYEIARARQQEIAARTIHAHHAPEMHGTWSRRRQSRQRFGRAIAALSGCLAVTIAVTVGGAHANPSSVKSGGRVSAQQYAGEIRALEAKGYVPASCTIGGTLMRNYRTGRSVTVMP
jgi:hypothetical protein